MESDISGKDKKKKIFIPLNKDYFGNTKILPKLIFI